MTRSILPDTDVLVDFFRGHVKAVAFINDTSDRIILSAIVVAELFAGVKGSAEQGTLEEFVSLFRVVPVNVEIAKAGGFTKVNSASHTASALRMPFWQPLLRPRMQS